MIHILPRFDYRMISAKSPEDLFLILDSVTNTRKFAFTISADTEFIGTISPPNFRIMSKINYRNSFLPVINGTIYTKEGRTVVDLRFRLHWFVRIFLAVWFGMTGLSFLIGLLLVLTERTAKPALLLTAASFLLVGQVLVRSAFYLPAKKAAARLEELLGRP